MFWELIGIIAASLTSFAFIPQIIKILRTKSAKDVSLITILQLGVGVGLWVAYGVRINNIIVIGANIVSLSTIVFLLFLYFIFKNE